MEGVDDGIGAMSFRFGREREDQETTEETAQGDHEGNQPAAIGHPGIAEDRPFAGSIQRREASQLPEEKIESRLEQVVENDRPQPGNRSHQEAAQEPPTDNAKAHRAIDSLREVFQAIRQQHRQGEAGEVARQLGSRAAELLRWVIVA